MHRILRAIFVYVEASGLQGDLFTLVGRCFPYSDCLDFLLTEIQKEVPHPKAMHMLYDHVLGGGNVYDAARKLGRH